MRRLVQIFSLLLLVCSSSLAAPGPEKLLAGILIYIFYTMVAICLVGWSFLVTTLVRKRVELTSQVLQTRPLASFVMGLLSLGWLFLSLVVGDKAGGLGGLLIVATLTILILCALVGLPAILVGVGRKAAPLWGGSFSLPRQLLLGSLILFTAGGFPWLGQILLLGLLVWSSGGAVLGFFAGSPQQDSEEKES